MCEELGDDTHMNAYVMDFGKTNLCSITSGKGCSDKEKKFIELFKTKSKEDVNKQIDRLNTMAGKSMKAELKAWVTQRIAILKQYAKGHEQEQEAKQEL